jgi:ferric-dicitrate binding protein FerR (iron transport regulator)
MPERARIAYEDWKRADEAAREAENRLKEAWDRFDRKEGPPPSEEQMAAVSRLRAAANEKLAAAMARMGGTSGSGPGSGGS